MAKPLRNAGDRIERARQAWFQRRLRRRGNELEPGCLVPRGSQIGTRIRVGRGTKFAGPIVVIGGEPVSFGRHCLAGRALRVLSSNHRIEMPAIQDSLQVQLPGAERRASPGPVSIGNGVWIGDAAIVLAGVEIGNGAVIGAGSVVTRSVAPFAIVAGSPAREIRKRFSEEVIRELEEIAWWDWPLEKIRANPELFGADLTGSRVSDHYSLGGQLGPAAHSSEARSTARRQAR
jgi:virginiamycin A acetyltransferase